MTDAEVDALFERSISTLRARQGLTGDNDVIALASTSQQQQPRDRKTPTKKRRRRDENAGAYAPGELPRDSSAKSKSKTDTAGAGWFDMPAFSADGDAGKKWSTTSGPTGDELRREVQAIRLRNSLDPKRFYRGGERGMPKYAQLGKIISSTSEPAATVARADRGKTVVDELVRDAEASAYAKRKFGEEQSKRAASWSSHVKRGKASKRGRR